MRTDILDNKELIQKLISENKSLTEISMILNCKYTTLKSYLKKMNINYSGNKSGKGTRKVKSTTKTTESYLYNGSTIQSNTLRKKLIKDNIFPNQCSRCLNSEWQGFQIALELDHIDGNPFNNELNNLRILCPNCHALTDTYRGKNKKTHIESQNCNKTAIPKTTKILKIYPAKICKTCNNEYNNSTGRGDIFCSQICFKKSLEKFNISKEELSKLVWEYPTIKLAEMLGVSDKAISKRCKKYQIEKPPRGYWTKLKNN